MNSTTLPDKPCDGSNYFLHGHYIEAPTSWRWFQCRHTQKCIHIDSWCDLHPNPQCIYEKDGVMVAEDEEGCFEEYKRKGLVAKTANIICSSPDHNTMSPAVPLYIYDEYILVDSFNVTVIPRGTTVHIQGVRCDGISDCWDGIDEQSCGFNSYQIVGIGKHFKHLEAIKFIPLKIIPFRHKLLFLQMKLLRNLLL